MRTVTLNAFSAGMTRLRTKGGPSEQTLYELTNGYVTASRTIQQRPAITSQTKLPPTSRGLCTFNGVFYTFTHAVVSNPGTATVRVLLHPDPSFSGSLSKVHFAQPFMGYLYVVAEFSDGNTYHYWLQDPPAWTAFTIYDVNELVQPTVPNGLYYQAQLPQDAPPAWQPLTQYHTADKVQPTVYNGFCYSAANLLPSDPTSSSDTEPTWPTQENTFVLESSGGGQSTQPTPPTPPPATPPGGEPGGRYGNPGGSGLGLGNRNRTFIP